MRCLTALAAGAMVLAAAQAPVFGASAATPDPKGPQYQMKGAQYRTYYFKEADESVPYRLYVPTKWNPAVKSPLLIWLNPSLKLDLPFERGDNVLEKMAEQRGYIVAVPGGYQRPKPRYNSPYLPLSAKDQKEGARAGQAPPPGSPLPSTPAEKAAAIERERSEQDVFHVIDIVLQEYNADPARVYMFGNSYAGEGVWYLAQKYARRFAAVGVGSAPINMDGYPYDKLQGVGLIVVHGDHDDVNSFEAAKKGAEQAKEHGVDVAWTPVKDGTHLEAWCLAMPQILDFFDKHRKSGK